MLCNPNIYNNASEYLDKIETLTDIILNEIGIVIKDDPISLAHLDMISDKVDMRIEEARVYMDGAQLRTFIRATAPQSFIWKGAESDFDVVVGASADPVFVPVYGPPKVRDLNGITQMGTIELYRQLVGMAQREKALQSTGHMICFVHDIPEKTRHLEMLKIHMRHPKPMMGTIASETATLEAIDLLGRGRPQDKTCNLLHLINVTPPLVYQENPLKALRAAAKNGEGVLVSSYMMMGLTSPVSVLETIAQGYAEVLVGLALAQIYSPGCAVVMGINAYPFSMSKMLPVYGDPISQSIQQLVTGLARRLGVPVRGDGGLTNSKILDAQAGYESTNATFNAMTSGADLILHATGWLESGRLVDFHKFNMDADYIMGLQKIWTNG